MKKQTFFSFLLIMLMSMIGDSSFAHDIEAKNADGVTIYYNWTNNETELAVTFRGSSETQYSSEYTGDVVIPESVNYNGITYPVTSIGKRAFWGCSRLASISIPNSVLEIGTSSFNGCSQLTSVTIGNSVESIGRGAFFDCKNLPSIVIPKSVTQIDNNIFMNCFSLCHIVVEEGNTVYDSRENCNAIVEKKQ